MIRFLKAIFIQTVFSLFCLFLLLLYSCDFILGSRMVVTCNGENVPAGGSLQFPDTMVGVDGSSLTITLLNDGIDDLVLTGNGDQTDYILFSGDDPDSFTDDYHNFGTLTLWENESYSIDIIFLPQSPGLKTAALSIPTNRGNYHCTVTGTGLVSQPEIDLFRNYIDAIDSGETLDLGACGIADTLPFLFCIKNTGGIDLHLTGTPVIDLSGSDMSQFSVSDPSLTVIPKNTYTNCTINFTPSSLGPKECVVTIENDDPDEGMFTFTIQSTSNFVNVLNETTSLDALSNPAIAVSLTDVYACYYDIDSTNLMFTRSTDSGSTWPAGNTIIVDAIGNVGLFADMAVSGSRVLISYWDVSNTNLKCAFSTDNGLTWLPGDRITVDDEGIIGMYTSICAKGNDIFIAYYDQEFGGLKLAGSADGGATWPVSQKKTLDTAGDTGLYADMAWNEPYIYLVYYDATNKDLKFLRSTNNGISWENSKIIDAAGETGLYPSIAVNGNFVYISYYDKTDSALRIAISTDYGAGWQEENFRVLVNDGSKHSKLAVSGSSLVAGILHTSYGLKSAVSHDNGFTWLQEERLFIDASYFNNSLFAITASGTNVFVCYTKYKNTRICRSTNEGNAWY